MRIHPGLLLALLLTGAARPPPETVAYSLAPEMRDGTLTGLIVEVRFRADPSGVTGFGWLPAWQGDRALWRWSRNVQFTGTSHVEKDGDGHWRISSNPGVPLKVRYQIISAYDHDPTVQDSEQTKPVIRPRWFYATGEALFGRPDNSDGVPATFTWRGAPPGFRFASDLEHIGDAGRGAVRAGTVTDVVESISIGGPDLRVFDAADGSGVRVAMIGQYAFPPDQLDDLARTVIRMERKFWGEQTSAPFLITATSIASSPAQQGFSGTGRDDAFALWIDQTAPLDRIKWLLAHEYFHTWNPPHLGRRLDNGPEAAAAFWFTEGFTDYYARALMVRAGLISPAEFAQQWNEMLLAYAASPARTMTGEQATAAFWTDAAAERLPYQRGAMLAAMWNARLRARSEGRINLDTIMLAQLEAARTTKSDPATLFLQLAMQQGLEVKADVDRYIRLGEPIMLPANIFGHCATVVTEHRPSFSRGYDAAATMKAGNEVTGIDRNSPAFAAGLRDGMKILERVTGETNNAVAEYALRVEDGGKERTIRYLPQGKGRVTVQQVKLASPAARCSATLGGVD